MMRSNNPAISALRNVGIRERVFQSTATYRGVALKAFYFILLTIAAASASVALLFTFPQAAFGVMIGCAVGTFVFGFTAAFFPRTIKVTGSLYCVCEGALVGAISAFIAVEYAGLVLAALLSTFGVFAVMTALYATGAIKVNHKFRSFMYSALLGIILVQLIIGITAIFVPVVREMFYGNNWFSVLISVGMVLFASFFILVDLYDITTIVNNGLDKKYEWRAAYSLTLTLIWLYLEFLRLFSKFADRR